jgi:PAS domain S-box-containing protein
MHPLRIIFFVSLALGAATSVAFGFLLDRLHVGETAVLLISGAVFLVTLVPWGAAFGWSLRRAGDLEELAQRTRTVARGHYDHGIAVRPFHGEVDDLARLNEELRTLLVRELGSAKEYRDAMQRIVDSMGEGLLAISHKGQIVFANERLASLFGYADRLSGRSLFDVVRKQPVIAAYDRALRGEESVERTSIGDRQFEVRVFPVARSKEIAAVALFIDVTHIERLQRIRRDFLDDFSHEVRTPLAGIRSAVESFDHKLTAEQEEQLRAIMLRQLGRIERLVNDLSELNHIESGEVTLNRRQVDLHHLAEDVAGEVRDRLGTGEIVVQGKHVFVFADAPRMQQVLTNLLDNAVKHGGGRGRIVVDLSESSGEAVVQIADEGPGIPPGENERIFHRFYRVDRSRAQNVPGIGLGLSIVKHLIAAHGGTIRAYNRPEGGAVFEFRLPSVAPAD